MQLRCATVVCGVLLSVACGCSAKNDDTKKTAAPASQQKANDPTAVALLQQMEQKHAQVRSVAGAFNQRRIDASFGADKVESTARFYLLKPNNFKVEYLSPKQSMNLITGQTSYYYVPEQKQVQKYTFKKQSTVRDLNYLLLGFGAPTQELLSVYYAQSGDTKNSIKLIPRDQKDAQFKYILMELTDGLLPKRFSMEQNDGGKLVVSIDAGSLQMGAPLNEANFQPNWPKGTSEVDMQ